MSSPVRHPLVYLTLARVREFTREPEAIFWAIFFPILLGTGLGIAFANRPQPVLKVAAGSPAIAAALKADPGFEVVESTPEGAREALGTGKVVLAAEPGPDGSVLFHYDNTDTEGRAAKFMADAAVQRAAGRTDLVRTTDAVTREPGSRYIDFVVAGLIGVGIMSNAVWGLGFSIVDTRRRKLLKRLMVTPMSRWHYLGSYLIWRLMLLPIEVAVPLVFGALAFGVPIRGSYFDILVLSVLTSMTFGSIGLLVSSRAKTIEAVSGLTNLAIMPMWVCSGVFFSAARFPDVVQPFIRALPLTAFLDALRGIQLQGASLTQFPREVATLVFWLVLCFTLALKLFRWR